MTTNRFRCAEVRRQGFTIVELLVVIVVIGILAAITIVSYTGITGRATQASLQSDLANASQQLKLYQIDHSAYPTSLDGSNCPVPADTKYCIKVSSGNALTYYQPNNTASPQTFSLYVAKGGVNYHITNDSTATISSPIVATGGTIMDVSGYRIHTFTSSGTFTVTSGTSDVEVLVVAGGGGGGGSVGYSGGGGGGGVVTSTKNISVGATTVTVGSGGAVGANGANSSFGAITSIGGGAGNTAGNGSNGGSGGGGGGAGTTGVGGSGIVIVRYPN